MTDNQTARGHSTWRVFIRLIAIGILALVAGAQQPRVAQACIKFDHAEMTPIAGLAPELV